MTDEVWLQQDRNTPALVGQQLPDSPPQEGLLLHAAVLGGGWTGVEAPPQQSKVKPY